MINEYAFKLAKEAHVNAMSELFNVGCGLHDQTRASITEYNLVKALQDKYNFDDDKIRLINKVIKQLHCIRELPEADAVNLVIKTLDFIYREFKDLKSSNKDI